MKSLVVLTGCLLVAGSFLCAASGEPPQRSSAATVTILHLNDSHGRYMPFEVADENATSQTGDPGGPPEQFDHPGVVGGFAYLATAVEQIRRRRGADRVLLVHAGDAFSDDLLGNLTEGESMIRLMNALGFDLLALGNHDFDYGQQRTKQLQQIAAFPMRGGNVIDQSSGEPFLGSPTKIFRIGAIRVGLLALGYHHTDLTTSSKNIPTLKFASGIETARHYVPELESRADLVVVVSHLGAAVDRKLARAVEGIDLILGGHSHDMLAAEDKIDGTWIAQSRSDLAVLGEVTITLRGGQIERVDVVNHVLWNDRYQADSDVQEMIDRLRRPYRRKLEQVLATATETIGRNYMSESPFDALVGEILRDATGAQVAMLPGIGYGVSLTPGPITREELYTLLPHPAKVSTVRLAGAQILEIMEQSAANIAPADPDDIVGGLLQTSGMQWSVDLTRPVGQRIDHVVIAGEPLSLQKTYHVVTHSGMLAGIHRYRTFQQGTDRETRDQKLVDVVEAAFVARQKVSPPKLGKVRLIQRVAP